MNSLYHMTVGVCTVVPSYPVQAAAGGLCTLYSLLIFAPIWGIYFFYTVQYFLLYGDEFINILKRLNAYILDLQNFFFTCNKNVYHYVVTCDTAHI